MICRDRISPYGGFLLAATNSISRITLGDVEIACAVLNSGQRVITQSGFMLTLGRARQAKGRAYYKGDVNLPAFLTAQNLKPFVSNVLEVTSSQITFRPLAGGIAFGAATIWRSGATTTRWNISRH